MYALLVPTLLVAGYGFYCRVRAWRRGQPENRFDRPLERIALLLEHGLLQLRSLAQSLSRRDARHDLLGLHHADHRHYGRDARL